MKKAKQHCCDKNMSCFMAGHIATTNKHIILNILRKNKCIKN